MMAGISSAYYLRLEQGRDTHPSAQVADALARTPQLDTKATEYSHRLASPAGSRWDHSGVEAAAGRGRRGFDGARPVSASSVSSCLPGCSDTLIGL